MQKLCYLRRNLNNILINYYFNSLFDIVFTYNEEQYNSLCTLKIHYLYFFVFLFPYEVFVESVNITFVQKQFPFKLSSILKKELLKLLRIIVLEYCCFEVKCVNKKNNLKQLIRDRLVFMYTRMHSTTRYTIIINFPEIMLLLFFC